MSTAKPQVTRDEIMSWCPTPRGIQPKGDHAEVPEMTGENADAAGFAQNRELERLIGDAVLALKKNDDPKDPEKGPRFVIQWRLFPNASNPNVQADSCACGCSCGCG